MAKTKLTDKGVQALQTDRPQEDYWDALSPENPLTRGAFRLTLLTG